MSVEFDHNLKNLFAQYEEPFDAQAWEQMEQGLDAQKVKKKRAGWLIFALCFIALSSSFYLICKWNGPINSTVANSKAIENNAIVKNENNIARFKREEKTTPLIAIEQTSPINIDLQQEKGETTMDKGLNDGIKETKQNKKSVVDKKNSIEKYPNNSINNKRWHNKNRSHENEKNISKFIVSKYELKKQQNEKLKTEVKNKADMGNELMASQQSKSMPLEIVGMDNQTEQFIAIEHQKDSLVNIEEKIFSIKAVDTNHVNRTTRRGKLFHWVASIQAGGGIGMADSSIHSPTQYQFQGMGGIAIHSKKNQPLLELTAGVGFQQNHYAVKLSEKIDDTSTMIKFENTYSCLTIPIQLKYYFLRGKKLNLFLGLTMINNLAINRSFTNTIEVAQIVYPSNVPPGKNLPVNTQSQYEKDQFPYPESAASIEKIQGDLYNKQSYYVSGMASLGLTYPIKKDKINWLLEGYYFIEPKILNLGYKHNVGLNTGLRFTF